MKIITYGEMQWNGEKYVTTYAEYEDYTGPVDECKGKGKGETQTTTQKAEPWGAAQAYLTGGVGSSGGGSLASRVNDALAVKGGFGKTGVLPEAERLYVNSKKNPFNRQELDAMGLMGDRVNRDYSLLGQGGDYLGAAARGEYLGSSPFMDAYGDDILNNVNSQFSKYNRTGSGQHAGIAGKELGDAAARMFQTERGLQQQAALALPGFEQSRYGLIDSDINALLQVGQMRQNRPRENLANYANLVNSVAGQGGTQTSQQPIYSNPGAALLGGAGMGASLFGTGGALAGVGGIGAGGGAGIGALLGLLSDRSAKENIRKVGMTDSGIPVYVYNYIGDPVKHMGVMADEVEHVPDAVIVRDGLKYVNYGVIN